MGLAVFCVPGHTNEMWLRNIILRRLNIVPSYLPKSPSAALSTIAVAPCIGRVVLRNLVLYLTAGVIITKNYNFFF
jgi:hypothetical protein